MYLLMYMYVCLYSILIIILFLARVACTCRWLEVSGNPLGCVQGVPDSVTYFDTYALSHGYYETVRCGDNCTQHTVYVPSDGVCVQCPDDTHAHGVGALNCFVLASARCPLRSSPDELCRSVLQCVATCCSVVPMRWIPVQLTFYSVLHCVALCCSVFRCVAVCCSVLQCVTVCCNDVLWCPQVNFLRVHHVLQCFAVGCLEM